MNAKLFWSTFLLIFLAELGDKTQLAAMARAAAGFHARWVVFAGAVLALLVFTLLAVLIGSSLMRVLSEPYVKAAAGVLFVALGFLFLARFCGELARAAILPALRRTFDALEGAHAGRLRALAGGST